MEDVISPVTQFVALHGVWAGPIVGVLSFLGGSQIVHPGNRRHAGDRRAGGERRARSRACGPVGRRRCRGRRLGILWHWSGDRAVRLSPLAAEAASAAGGRHPAVLSSPRAHGSASGTLSGANTRYSAAGRTGHSNASTTVSRRQHSVGRNLGTGHVPPSHRRNLYRAGGRHRPRGRVERMAPACLRGRDRGHNYDRDDDCLARNEAYPPSAERRRTAQDFALGQQPSGLRRPGQAG